VRCYLLGAVSTGLTPSALPLLYYARRPFLLPFCRAFEFQSVAFLQGNGRAPSTPASPTGAHPVQRPPPFLRDREGFPSSLYVSLPTPHPDPSEDVAPFPSPFLLSALTPQRRGPPDGARSSTRGVLQKDHSLLPLGRSAVDLTWTSTWSQCKIHLLPSSRKVAPRRFGPGLE